MTMTATPDLLQTVLALLSGIGQLRQRKMFGGIYIYCDDLFIATLHDGTLYFKANKNTAQEFIDRGLHPFSYPRQGEIATLQYYQAPGEVFGSRAAMQRWASRALVAARQDAALKKPRKVCARERNTLSI
jgi:DNA transformation protein and related proteins